MIWKNPSALIHNKWKKNLKCVACCPDDMFEKKRLHCCVFLHVSLSVLCICG